MPHYELNIRDYLRIFRKRRLIIFLTFVIVSVSSYFYTKKETPVFTTSATVKIEERKTIAGLLTESIIYNPADRMESETKVIKGYPILKKVAFKLKLLKEDSSIDEVNTVVNELQGGVETERLGNTNMIRIITTSDDPQKAMILANTVAEVYIDDNLTEKARQSRQEKEFIEEQLAALESRLKDAEEKYRAFGDSVKNIKLAEPVQQRLVAMQFQLNELLQQYTDKHPKIMQLREQIRQMEEQMSGISGQELDYSRLAREVEVNKKLYSMLKEKLEEARITESQKVPDVSLVNPAMLPAAPLTTSNRKMTVMVGAILGIVLGFSFAFLFETLDTSIGTIDDVERVIKLNVLGVVPSMHEDAKTRCGPLERFKQRFMPITACDSEERFTRLFAHFKPMAPATEAFRNIHTNMKVGPGKNVIVVTSSGPSEGKSTIVSNLGIVMAQSGLKTLLLSADLRRPVLSRSFGIKREPGLSELILGAVSIETAVNNITDMMVGELTFEDIRKTAGLDNLFIIPSGHLPTNPVELLESKKLLLIIDELKKMFDVIIFDVPPVLPVTDASILAAKANSVVLVYESGRTSREALMRAKVQLQSVGAKIDGIILNNTKPQSEAIEVYPYYRRYQKAYYGDQGKENEKRRRG